MDTYTVNPVGVVRVQTDELSVLEIKDEYKDALLRIAHCDKLQVLFWMHELDEAVKNKLQAHPMKHFDKPPRGVFALRSPFRPNPIGVTIVELIQREGNQLTVKGLDARDGSPIIDIKCS